MGKKYKIVYANQIQLMGANGITETVHQIQALRSIPAIGVFAGDLGGHVSNEECLSQYGSCWVFRGSTVTHAGRVIEDAVIKGNSTISTEAVISEKCQVIDSDIMDGCYLEDRVLVERSTLTGKTMLSGNFEVKDSVVFGIIANSGEIVRSRVKSHHEALSLKKFTSIVDSTLGIYDAKPMIEAGGSFLNVTAEKLMTCHLYGTFEATDATFEGLSHLTILEHKNPSVIDGNDGQCVFQDASLFFFNTKITGSIQVQGIVNLYHCLLQDVSRIENETTYGLTLENVNLSEFASIHKVEKGITDVRLSDKTIGADTVMVC